MSHLLSQLSNLVAGNLSPNGESVRLFHGRGKLWEELEHLSIDFYGPTLLITTYKEISDAEKAELVSFLLSLNELKFTGIVLQKRHGKNLPIEKLWGELPLESFAVEKDEKYFIDLERPQNIGFFLDMATGREWVRKNAKGKKVLNLFSYTCSLSVAAFFGEAQEVVNVDMSKAALSVGRKNHELNFSKDIKMRFFDYDILKSLGTLSKKGPYDLIIIDPPSNQGLSFKVERDYAKIVRKLDQMTSDQSFVMACLNAPHLDSSFLRNTFLEFAPNFKEVDSFFSAFSSMESNKEMGLKVIIFQKNQIAK